jgi:hypothetical protein
MGMAGQRYEAEGGSGGGSFGVHLRTADGTDFIIELKHVPSKNPKTGKFLTGDKLRKNTLTAVKKALKQIEDRKYTLKLKGDKSEIFKVALVISGYNEVTAVFERALNWRLKPGLSSGFAAEQA